MNVLGPVLIVVLTVVVMEGVAYSVHRWIMHGPLGWGWHKSHHEDRHGVFEKNDLYAVVFAVISILLSCSLRSSMRVLSASIFCSAARILRHSSPYSSESFSRLPFASANASSLFSFLNLRIRS